MIIELAICLTALIGSIGLAWLAVKVSQHRRWLRLACFVSLFLIMHTVASTLVGQECAAIFYRAADPRLTFLSYDRMLGAKREAIGQSEVFRTFEKEWWNY